MAEMNEEKYLFKDVIKQEALQVEADFQEHPPVEELSYYLEGLLDENEEKAIRQHLVYCQKCADLVLALKEPLGFDVAEVLAEERLPEPIPFAIPNPPPSRNPVPPKRRRISMSWASIAAVLIIGLLFVFTNHPEPSKPGIENPILLRMPSSLTVRSPVQIVTLPDDYTSLLVEMSYSDLRAFDSYYMELHSPEGNTTRFDNFQQLPGPLFLKAIPRALLDPGVYSLKLFGQDRREEPQELTVWRIEIQ